MSYCRVTGDYGIRIAVRIGIKIFREPCFQEQALADVGIGGVKIGGEDILSPGGSDCRQRYQDENKETTNENGVQKLND